MTTAGTGVRLVAGGVQADWQSLGPRPSGCTAWGTIGDDIIPGTRGRDVLCGGIGNDTLVGFSGDDSLVGGFDDDTLDGGAGNDGFRGDYGDDVLLARDGARDVLEGAGSAATAPRRIASTASAASSG